ncbi:MAG: extracellular solute-binding protein [Chloroflexi bacterium]|nr:extracellular solute-binding protein [Chloroflexota bacterium]
MNRRNKVFSVVALLGILAGLLSGCISPKARDARSFVIAVVEENPGEAGRPNPQSAYAGVRLAVDQMRDYWGVDIQVVPYTDGNDANTAILKAQEITQSGAIAVIGHSSIETSLAAADIYEQAGIPVLNVAPVTEKLSLEHPHFFNTTYTAESEAAYIANYLRKINGAETASVIATNDGYGQTLARQFKNTFKGLGGHITIEGIVRPSNEEDMESAISNIISANPETNNPGTIFIATDDKTAAQLIVRMKRKGVSYPLAGASSLTTPAFLELIREEPEEETIPGYYTDGILATRAIIFDSANRFANQFRRDFQGQYNDEPGDLVVNGYDAALVVMAGIRSSRATGAADATEQDRELLYKALLAMDDGQTGVQGIINSIYFEPSRNIVRAARFGIYQSGKLISANTQFEPITTPNEIKDLPAQLAKGRIMTVNGAYVYKANVVYAGVDLLGIEQIDIKTSSYKVDFYLWFRYRPNEQDEDFKPDDFVFTNAEGDWQEVPVREEANADGTFLKTYRISGVFKNQFQFHAYPFDHQDLVVEFRNQNANTSLIQYVVDQIGMRYENEEVLLKNFRDNGAFDSIYGWDERHVEVTQDVFPTFSTFGSPQNFGRKVATNYSLINIKVDVQRSSLQYIIKSLLPLLMTLILAYITFFLPLGHSERLAVGSTALLTTAFFHLTLADSLPEIGYTVAMEYLFYASYLMSALIVLLETISIRYEKFGEEAKKKNEKERFQEQRKRLNTIGRLIYPTILLIVLGLGFFVYNGQIALGSQSAASSRRMVEFILDREPPSSVASLTDQSADGDTVKLKLATWRPEDTEQIQVLLDAFHAYAESLGRDIVIEHEPIVSVNYDSILDIQLSREQGADLLYVRPFSVDGSIARYLTPLNNLPITDHYDETKIEPWKNRVGVFYAVPYVGVVQGVYYNRDLFDRYGITEPKTWNEFIGILRTISQQNPNIIPIANGLNEREDSEMFMSIAANFLGGPEGRARMMRTDGTSLCYNSARVVNAFRAIEELKPYLPENAGTISTNASKELFFDKQAVMLFGGSWDLQKVSEKAGFNWGVFAVPANAFSETYVIFQPDIAIGINRDSPHPQEARLFLEWLMSEEAVNLTSRNLAGFYPLNKNKPIESSGPDDSKFLSLIRNYPSDIRWMFTEISDKIPTAADIVRKNLHRMVTENLTPQEAAQDLQNGLGEWYEPAQNCK